MFDLIFQDDYHLSNLDREPAMFCVVDALSVGLQPFCAGEFPCVHVAVHSSHDSTL